MTVDPKVHELAAAFIDDMLQEAYHTERRPQLVERLAQAMQRAIEDECEAIRQEYEE